MNNRIEEILQLQQQEPDDPFLWYALALEYVKNGEQAKAGEVFDTMLKRFPDYLPLYYQAAHFYWEEGSFDKAGYVFKIGINLAGTKGDTKTLQELTNSYQNFLLDTDES
jgi:Tfp pilus assembly protein PilF